MPPKGYGATTGFIRSKSKKKKLLLDTSEVFPFMSLLNHKWSHLAQTFPLCWWVMHLCKEGICIALLSKSIHEWLNTHQKWIWIISHHWLTLICWEGYKLFSGNFSVTKFNEPSTLSNVNVYPSCLLENITRNLFIFPLHHQFLLYSGYVWLKLCIKLFLH